MANVLVIAHDKGFFSINSLNLWLLGLIFPFLNLYTEKLSKKRNINEDDFNVIFSETLKIKEGIQTKLS